MLFSSLLVRFPGSVHCDALEWRINPNLLWQTLAPLSTVLSLEKRKRCQSHLRFCYIPSRSLWIPVSYRAVVINASFFFLQPMWHIAKAMVIVYDEY